MPPAGIFTEKFARSAKSLSEEESIHATHFVSLIVSFWELASLLLEVIYCASEFIEKSTIEEASLPVAAPDSTVRLQALAGREPEPVTCDLLHFSFVIKTVLFELSGVICIAGQRFSGFVVPPPNIFTIKNNIINPPAISQSILLFKNDCLEYPPRD